MKRLAALLARRPLLAVFVLALGVRLVAWLVLHVVVPDDWLALDDDTYATLAEQVASGSTESWSSYRHWLYAGTATFLVPLTGLYWLLGPHEFLGPALVAVVGAGAAATTARLASAELGLCWALGAGAVVGVLPSQVGWSVTTLKDPWVWLVASALGIAVMFAYRQERSSPLAWIGVAVLLFLMSHLRMQSVIVAGWAVFLVSLVGVRRQGRRAGAVLALILATAVPWAAGAGPAGIDAVGPRIANLDQVRRTNAIGASSAIVEGREFEAEAQGDTFLEPPGDWLQAVAHLPKGLSVMLLQPYPWEENRTSQIVLAKMDTILWYPLLVLAALGLLRLKRYSRVLLFPFLYGSGMLMVYALAEGNLGTAFRHRGELVWVMALFAAFGAEMVWARRGEERASPGDVTPIS